jgi:hypothetical protein
MAKLLRPKRKRRPAGQTSRPHRRRTLAPRLRDGRNLLADYPLSPEGLPMEFGGWEDRKPLPDTVPPPTIEEVAWSSVTVTDCGRHVRRHPRLDEGPNPIHMPNPGPREEWRRPRKIVAVPYTLDEIRKMLVTILARAVKVAQEEM